MNTPTERALNFLLCGAFTFSGNLVIPKLLAIFELPYRLARPKLVFLALGRPARARIARFWAQLVLVSSL